MKDFMQTKRPASASYSIRALQPARSDSIASAREAEPNNLPTQLERAARSGHSLARVSIASPGRENPADLPAGLKARIKGLSGLSMDDVRVHYNSSRPAALQALAHTRGSDIHVGPGQEKHLPHEAWHVVQQKQGRVKPTVQDRGMWINDEENLESEADVMGGKAAQVSERVQEQDDEEHLSRQEKSGAQTDRAQSGQIIQMVRTPRGRTPGERAFRVPGIRQSDANLCWAAVGWSIHRYKRGTAYASEQAFVTGEGSARAQTKYAANAPTDIDNIIGSQANTNRLTGEDSVRPFAQAIITREINRRHPIVANVNRNHYIIISGYRTRNGRYQVQRMDPATGRSAWVDTTRSSASAFPRITKAGPYTLSVLYYTK